ncbi:hypothetical protein EAH_00017250 [Eimeria acervulina]|uniref:Uncharacterized protein n=1 Tax=Eimeria acervulina TaxID=5801 RepID=U6G9S9_EIMAC|nr:hypothetical protein EAH_00017250 [Eimeria acervulina]CDI76297.1 hypothetical protein EAH_00017250 [Eimeria acervulina]
MNVKPLLQQLLQLRRWLLLQQLLLMLPLPLLLLLALLQLTPMKRGTIVSNDKGNTTTRRIPSRGAHMGLKEAIVAASAQTEAMAVAIAATAAAGGGGEQHPTADLVESETGTISQDLGMTL